jgi:hypothetical protein
LGVRYQNYTGKAIFMPLSIGAGIDKFEIIFLGKNNIGIGGGVRRILWQAEGDSMLRLPAQPAWNDVGGV